jgi:hypothetical protein
MVNKEGGFAVDHGFKEIVEQVTRMDKTLGIFALSQFTHR